MNCNGIVKLQVPFSSVQGLNEKSKKEKKNITNGKLKQKINNDHFLKKLDHTPSYNFENIGKYYLTLGSTEGQWLIVQTLKSVLS